MARSVKKGPFVDGHLMKKVETAQASKDKRPVKTCTVRACNFSSLPALNNTKPRFAL